MLRRVKTARPYDRALLKRLVWQKRFTALPRRRPAGNAPEQRDKTAPTSP